MNDELLQAIDGAVDRATTKYVNGKIDALHIKIDIHNTKHEEDMTEVRKHMEDVKPYLEGARGVKVLGEALKWVAGLSVMWIAWKGIWPR